MQEEEYKKKAIERLELMWGKTPDEIVMEFSYDHRRV